MKRAVLGVWVVVCLWGVAPGEAAAIFRFDEIDRRDFEYNDEYFLNLFSFRQRLTHRWSSQDASLAYDITAGSIRSDELYLEQRARLRLPITNELSAEFRYEEWEDYDARYQRTEVELVLRLFRPALRPALWDDPGHVPPPDGLFVGGLGTLDADKEFADIGATVGYAERAWGVRLDVWLADFFFNGKNALNAEYDTAPITYRVSGFVDLWQGDLQLSAWTAYDAPLRLSLPERQQLDYRYEQVQFGLQARWQPRNDFRADFEVRGEYTRKQRRFLAAPGQDERLERQGYKAWVAAEWDVAPLLGEDSSRSVDTVLFGIHTHYLNEDLDRVLDRTRDITIRRGEAYAELGYVLGLPSFHRDYGFGLRVATQNGFLSERDVRVSEEQHTVSRSFLSKLGVGMEVVFRDNLALGFFQLTFRVDELTFGGGNAQVVFRF